MPSDEYTSVARGPLKLKGAAGVTKKKKKKDKDKKEKSDLKKNLSTGSSCDATTETTLALAEEGNSRRDSPAGNGDNRGSTPLSPGEKRDKVEGGKEKEEEDTKTEAERRFAEAKRKRLKELTESGRIRPELLKTHKQRVEELNAHLARLSEHHDMPKIGPG